MYLLKLLARMVDDGVIISIPMPHIYTYLLNNSMLFLSQACHDTLRSGVPQCSGQAYNRSIKLDTASRAAVLRAASERFSLHREDEKMPRLSGQGLGRGLPVGDCKA